MKWSFLTKANLNLCQRGLKDLGIKAINLLLSKLKPANNLVPNACCSISFHIILCHKWVTVPHQTDRADLLWRIHRHFAESKLTSFCLDAGWEISPCLGWKIWLITDPPGPSWHRAHELPSPGLLTFPAPNHLQPCPLCSSTFSCASPSCNF